MPGFAGTESILLATGIIGATVMPHVIYLHSALTQRRVVGRNEGERRKILGFERVDVVIALSLAGAVNLSMMIVAAALFHGSGLTGVDSIEGAFNGFKSLVSDRAATIFGIALLASGFASSSVGTMAGQVVMQGFIRRRIPIFVRRAITLAPALIVLGVGLDPTDALVAQPGRALLRDSVCAGAAVDDCVEPEGDGGAGQSALADRDRGGAGGDDHRPQCLSAAAGFLRVARVARARRPSPTPLPGTSVASASTELGEPGSGEFSGHAGAGDCLGDAGGFGSLLGLGVYVRVVAEDWDAEIG